MSTRRLVQRSRPNEDPSPAPRSRPRNSQAASGHREAAPLAQLPPYEPPNCPLTAAARRELDDLRVNHDYNKYSRHLQSAKSNLTNTAADAHDRLRLRRENVERQSEKRRRTGSNEKSQAEIEAEELADTLEVKVMEIATKAEIAMREMIDYGDELAMNDNIMKDVSDNIPHPPAPRPIRRQRRQDDSDDENGNPAAEEDEVRMEMPDVSGVSTIDLLKQAKEGYQNQYATRSMQAR